MKKTMRTIDLFSGAGGFSLGFELAGFDSVLAIDLWKDAIDTFNYNRKLGVGKSIDIHDFKDDMVIELRSRERVNGIIGGPPCQGFSMVGKREENDNRNSLYLEYVRFVELLKPDFFILENVKGLLTLAKGAYKEDIIHRFGALGYNVNFKVLMASDYGVPQNRERVFFVGLNRDIFGANKFFEYPIPLIHKVTTKDALEDLPSLDNPETLIPVYKSHPTNEYQKFMRRNSSDIVTNHDQTKHSKETLSIIKLVPDGGSIVDLPEDYYAIRNYKNTFKRMNSSSQSITIDCGHRNYFHYRENRVPSVREAARLQSFPDHYFFTGSKTSQYTQVGNAVPPLLAYEIAKKILNTYKEVEYVSIQRAI